MCILNFILLCVVCCCVSGVIVQDVVYVGGLFQAEEKDQEIAFKYAINRINMDRNILPKTVLEIVTDNVTAIDSFTAEKKVCNLTSGGIAAIFGPQHQFNSGIVKSVCYSLEIPHFINHWEVLDDQPTFTINMHPDPVLLSTAVADLIIDLNWKSFTILYENYDSLIRLQEVLKVHTLEDPPVIVRQLDKNHDYRPMLKRMHAHSESRIVLDCALDRVLDVLRQAKEVKMMEDYQAYIIPHLDTHTLDVSEFQFTMTNVTTLRILDPTKPEIRNAVYDMEVTESREGREMNVNPNKILAKAALIYDSVQLFARAFHILNKHAKLEPKAIGCDQGTVWEDGLRLLNFIKAMEHKGLTGPAKFDTNGRRTFFQVDILDLANGEFSKIGTWDPIERINYTRSFGDAYEQVVLGLRNKTFRVASRTGRPYLEKRQPEANFTGNDRYEGFSMDLIHEISKLLKFKYEFAIAPDNKYGSFKNGKWDGIIREILDGRADLGICDLTITQERRGAVDFTMPFMTLGISILFSKPMKEPPDLFSFLSPFSLDVWMYMATAYLGVSLLLFVLARLSPYEWINPHPCKNEPEEMENNLNMNNSIWHNCGSLMQQGSDIAPKAVSTRMVAGMWWFFTLIMISSYTANLAAFLTSGRMEETVSNAEDLAKQSKIKYGCLAGGSTETFFKNSNFSTFQRMWAAMESARPSVFPANNDEGVDRVIKGKRLYAFIMESTSIEYQVERNCQLQQIGNLLDTKGYGIAMPMNSPYRTAISGAVLKLQESGTLHMLKEKWWKEMEGGGKCKSSVTSVDDSSAELGLANVGGVFVVLALGCTAAFLMSVLEFLWNIRKIAVEEGMTPKEALIEELKFAIEFKKIVKPVRKKKESSSGSGESSHQLDIDLDKQDLTKS